MTEYISAEARERIRLGKPISRNDDPFLIAYITRGDTYVIASNGNQTDSGKPNDLLCITRHGQVVELCLNVAPELVEEVKEIIK